MHVKNIWRYFLKGCFISSAFISFADIRRDITWHTSTGSLFHRIEVVTKSVQYLDPFSASFSVATSNNVNWEECVKQVAVFWDRRSNGYQGPKLLKVEFSTEN